MLKGAYLYLPPALAPPTGSVLNSPLSASLSSHAHTRSVLFTQSSCVLWHVFRVALKIYGCCLVGKCASAAHYAAALTPLGRWQALSRAVPECLNSSIDVGLIAGQQNFKRDCPLKQLMLIVISNQYLQLYYDRGKIRFWLPPPAQS